MSWPVSLQKRVLCVTVTMVTAGMRFLLFILRANKTTMCTRVSTDHARAQLITTCLAYAQTTTNARVSDRLRGKKDRLVW